MSKLCLGTVQFGLRYGINNALGRQPNRRECYGIISEALYSGITKFDTASAYGEAESLLGGFPWREVKAGIISKLPPGCIDDASVVEEKVRESLDRLGQKKLYGYMLHRANDMSKEYIMTGMVAVKENGLAEKIGVSVYEPEEAMHAVDDQRIDIIQIPYNVLDKRLDKVGFFAKARENNKEVYARSSFLQGLLLMKPETADSRVRGAGKWIAKFHEIANGFDYAPVEAAFLYSLSHSGIDYVVFGVDTVEQLRSNLFVQKKLSGFDNCFKALSEEFMDVPREVLVPNLWS